MKWCISNIGQLATCPADSDQADTGTIQNAALLIDDGVVQWAGPETDLPAAADGAASFDADGKLVIPGLVDCHTHLCFGGWRGNEFAQRIAGATYQDIAAAGGGIASTVKATRETSAGALLEKAKTVLEDALSLGVTTMECKSGYGLDFNNEIKQLEVYSKLDSDYKISLVPTFLGAHIVPPEYRDNRGDYIDLLCEKLIPEIARRRLARFCDVFIEDNAYALDEARHILSTARDHGLGLKVHADQLSAGGGAELAAAMGAASAEHLEFISDEGITAMARAGTVAVSLPIASMYLGQGYLPARRLIDAGVAVAVATDFNPGSSPSYHLPLAMTLACINQRMTPAEVLCGATSIAARAVGLGGQAGSLTVGSPADLVVIDAPDINHWLYHFRPNAAQAVMKSGDWAVI